MLLEVFYYNEVLGQ